jgi:curved DNA-binding protein CbpA
MRDHYERLGVQRDDDRETIWRAYLGAVRSALSGSKPAVDLRALDQAWAVLSDPQSRAAYDLTLEDRTREQEIEPPAPRSAGLASLPPAPATDETAPAQDAPAPESGPAGEAAEPRAAMPASDGEPEQ